MLNKQERSRIIITDCKLGCAKRQCSYRQKLLKGTYFNFNNLEIIYEYRNGHEELNFSVYLILRYSKTKLELTLGSKLFTQYLVIYDNKFQAYA